MAMPSPCIQSLCSLLHMLMCHIVWCCRCQLTRRHTRRRRRPTPSSTAQPTACCMARRLSCQSRMWTAWWRSWLTGACVCSCARPACAVLWCAVLCCDATVCALLQCSLASTALISGHVAVIFAYAHPTTTTTTATHYCITHTHARTSPASPCKHTQPIPTPSFVCVLAGSARRRISAGGARTATATSTSSTTATRTSTRRSSARSAATRRRSRPTWSGAPRCRWVGGCVGFGAVLCYSDRVMCPMC